LLVNFLPCFLLVAKILFKNFNKTFQRRKREISMNTIHIAGHLGKDPETRVTPSGQKLTVLVVATNIYQGGKEDTIWWRVTVWGDDFKKKIDYLKKGSPVFIVGEMRNKPEAYNDKEGRPQVSLNITAVAINFSPFGRSDRANSDRPNQEQRPANPVSQAQPFQGGYDNQHSGEPEFLSSAAGSFGGAPQYASGNASHHNSNDEEMPF
jgi:single-strand DNA-binding protein